MYRRWMLLVGLVLLLVAARSVEGEVNPTPWSVDFVGKGESTLGGQLLPEGAVVRAYDPTGVLAGQTEVALAGWYLLAVYGDDHFSTPDLDEGAEAGDRIAFTVNDYPAVSLGPDQPVWELGNRPHVELQASTLFGDFDADCRVTVADLMRQVKHFGVSGGEAGYYPPFDRDNDDDVDIDDIRQVAGEWRVTCPE